jgi:serine/threonine-protein kinase RsbW
MERDIIISSKIENLRTVEKTIDDIAAEYNISSELYGNILIAILEGVNNAVTHGNKEDASKNVSIHLSLDEETFKVSIQDEGPGFDYKNVPDPTAPENLENINGRGIFLMDKLSDKIEFFENGKKVELTFKL